MSWLFATSVLWAFSFGLIKGRLAGIDPVFVAFARLGLSAVVFLPFLRPMRFRPDETMKLMGIGALQYGLMYVLYLSAYGYLQAHEVALFTVTTPLYVSLLARVLEGDRSVRGPLAATLAVLGSLAIAASALTGSDLLIGFLLLQGANLAFAAGQMLWRRVAAGDWKQQLSRFGLLYVGAAGVCGLATVLTSDVSSADVSADQWLTLGYLGVIASGLGFFMWNLGATRASAAGLAVMNNLKVPLAVLISFVVFGEQASGLRLALSIALFAAALALSRQADPGRQNAAAG